MMENDDNIARKSPSSDQDKTIDDVSCSSLADDNLMEDTDDVVCQSKESAAQQDEAANLERSHGSNDESAITSNIEEDALCDKEKSSPLTTLGKRSRSNSDDLQEEQHQQQQVHLTQQDNAGGRTNTDNYFGLDPAEWNMRTIKANLVAPVGMYLTKQGDVIRVQIDTQADQLGIKVRSKLISVDGELYSLAALSAKLDGRDLTLVFAEPRHYPMSIVRRDADGWFTILEQDKIQEACRQQALHVLTEYDLWILQESSDTNPLVEEVVTLMYQQLCSEVATPSCGSQHQCEYKYSDNCSPWGVPEWMVCDGRFRLVGPQLWMVTRRLALQCTQQIYNQTRLDVNRWAVVQLRSDWLTELFHKRIREHLQTIGVVPKNRLVKSIAIAFIQEHAATCSWYRLTEFYVAACYERWVAAKGIARRNSTILKDVQYWSCRPCIVVEPLLETTFRTYMKNILHEKFPLAEDWNVIVNQAWLCFRTKFVLEPKAVSERDVLDLLEDMEEELSFVSMSNRSLGVRVKSNAFVQDFSMSSSPILNPQPQEQPLPQPVLQGQPPPHLIAESDSNNSNSCEPIRCDDDKSLSSESQDADLIVPSAHENRGGVANGDKNTETGLDDGKSLFEEIKALKSKAGFSEKEKKGRGRTKSCDGSSTQSKRARKDLKETTFERAKPLSNGERVYARWPENDSWYWGYIFGVQTKKGGCKYRVRFDDGDELDGVDEKYVCTEAEYELSELAKGEGQKDYLKNDPVARGAPLSLHKLFLSRCGECNLCCRKACARCFSCRGMKKPEEVCVQKMCCAIPLARKTQPAPWLGDGYRFAFVDPGSWESASGSQLKYSPAYWRGLVLITPTGSEIRNALSFVGKKWEPKMAHTFLSQIGFDKTHLDQITTLSQSTSMSPRELYENRCNSCLNCLSEECMRCSSCLANADSSAGDRLCCLQKMCCALELERKAQPAVTFPYGWTFAFDLTSNHSKLLPQYKGLNIQSPQGLKFCSVEAAIARRPESLTQVDPVQFYNKVGLIPIEESSSKAHEIASDTSVSSTTVPMFFDKGLYSEDRMDGIARDSVMRPLESINGVEVYCEEDATPFSPKELSEAACGACSLCQEDDCGVCDTCKRNQTYTRRYKEVCLRKMCRLIPLQKKAQSAPGFPPGWKFAFYDPSDLSSCRTRAKNSEPELQGLRLFRKPNFMFGSISAALRYCKGSEEQYKEFCKHVGANMWRNEEQHVLLGEGYCRQWTDVTGRPRIIHGQIAKCERHRVDENRLQFTVAYHPSALLSSPKADNTQNTVIPERESFDSKWAWGGNYQARAKALEPVPSAKPLCSFRTWHIPDQHHENLALNDDGSLTPQLTLFFRSFMLVFNVGPSSIPNAGNGVFVTCTSLAPAGKAVSPYFELELGEFLDLGIYAPFRAEDRKSMHIVILKNFIHSLSCEEWGFDTFDDDFQYDITDDVKGDVHELARKHIPAYVNECSPNQNPSVHAWHDPEGSVHYLLGHEDDANGKFQLPADGKTLTEIFIDYGSKYEYVRIRKGYSRLSPDERLPKIQQMERDEHEYIREIHTFSCSELKDANEFFSPIFQNAAAFVRDETRERALCVAILLKTRAQAILSEFANLDVDSESICDNGVTSLDVKALVGDFDNLILTVCKRWEEPEAMRDDLLRKDLFADLLKEVWQLNDLSGLTAREFVGKIQGNKN